MNGYLEHHKFDLYSNRGQFKGKLDTIRRIDI